MGFRDTGCYRYRSDIFWLAFHFFLARGADCLLFSSCQMKTLCEDLYLLDKNGFKHILKYVPSLIIFSHVYIRLNSYDNPNMGFNTQF
jgi:hypothetical protein